MLKTAAEFIAQAQAQIECVNLERAQQLYRDHANAVILDVREADTANQSKLTDSINISRGLLEMKVAKAIPDEKAVILTHCGGGGRASLAAARLQEMGYLNVYAITETFDDLKKAFG